MSAESEEPPAEYAPSLQARRFRTTGVPRSSRRRMSAGRRLWYAVLVALARGLLGTLWATCRVRVVRGEEHLDALRQRGSPAVIIYWHQMHVFAAWLMRRQARKGMRLGVLVSPSVTGEVPAAMIRHWGMRPVRGSSTRSAAEALRDMYVVVGKEQTSLVIAADGPKGPVHEVKPGAILLAKMSKAPVVPLAWAANRCSRWDSWDRFMVPWPFSRIALVVGEPWEVPPGFTIAQLPAATAELGQRLQALAAEAGRLAL